MAQGPSPSRDSPLQLSTSNYPSPPGTNTSPGPYGIGHLSPEEVRMLPDGVQTAPGPSDGGEDSKDSKGDFAQTFYDPFRIKHRRRTSPPQLKILEYHFERNPKPDVALRKTLSEQLDMTPREVQVWFQNRRAKTKKLREKSEKEGAPADDAPGSSETNSHPPIFRGSFEPGPSMPSSSSVDYLGGRRGSSPAVMSAKTFLPHGVPANQHHQAQMYNSHSQPSFEPPPPLPLPINSPPQHHPHLQLHSHSLPTGPPRSQHPPTYSNSHSGPRTTHDGLTDFPHPISHPPSNRYDDAGRRFSLPAYPSSYGSAPTYTGGPNVGYPPPTDMFASGDTVSPYSSRHSDYAYSGGGISSLDDGSDYSGSSSADDARRPVSSHQVPQGFEYYNLAAPSSTSGGGPSVGPYESAPLGSYTFGSAWRPTTSTSNSASTDSSGGARGDYSLSPADYSTSATSPIDAFGSPDGGGRRSSCPPGLVPTFDNLVVSSSPGSAGSWPPQYPPSSQGGAGASYPYAPVPHLHPTTMGGDRRGSTSSLLGTIAELPSGVVMPLTPFPPSAYDEGGTADQGLGRKVRSQANLRAATYPVRSPPASDQGQGASQNGIGGLDAPHERRGSVPGPGFEFGGGQQQQQQQQQEFWRS